MSARERVNTRHKYFDLALLNYFLLVFLLAIPFWLFGGGKLPLPFNLPVSALVTFVPMIAAALLSYRQSGFTGVKALLARTWDAQRISNKRWYAPALLLAPAIYLLSYTVMRWGGWSLPAPKIPLLLAPLLFLLFFINDAGEELGWSGYAIDPLQRRWGAVKAGFLLGVVWAIWHAIPFLQTGNSTSWIVWQSLKTVAMRILIVWIYNNSGKSVLAANLYHTSDNLSWALFPNYSSHYDPLVTGIITSIMAAIALVSDQMLKKTENS